MKQKLSISIEADLLEKMDKHLQESWYRNKSHFVEMAISKFMKEDENDRQ